MTDADQLYAATTFEEFWVIYQRMHSRRSTRIAHAVGTTSAGVLLLLGLARRSVPLLLLAPLTDYAISQASHRGFERNATHPYRRPVWHARAELRMWRREMRRLGRKLRPEEPAEPDAGP